MKYQFECGCTGTKTKNVKNKAGSKIKSCPKCRQPIKFKIVNCMDCKKVLYLPKVRNHKIKCEACREEARKAKNKKRYIHSGRGYRTSDELDFIEKLKPETALSYYNGLLKRVDWCGMSKHKCLDACRLKAGV